MGARGAQHRAGPFVVSRHGGRRVVGGPFVGVDVRREDVLPLYVRGDAVVEAYFIRGILPPQDRRRGHGAAVRPPRVDSRTRVHVFRLLLAGPPQPSQYDAGLRLAVVIGNIVRAVVVRFRDGARVKGRRVAVAALYFGSLRQRLVAPLPKDVAPFELLRRIVVEDDGVRVALYMLYGRRAHFAGAVPRVDGLSLGKNLALALAGQPRAPSCDVLLLFVGVVGDAEPRAVAGRDGGRSKVGRRPVTDLAADAGLEIVHLLRGCLVCICWVRRVGQPFMAAQRKTNRGAAPIEPGNARRAEVLVASGQLGLRRVTGTLRLGAIGPAGRGGQLRLTSSDCHHGEAGWRGS